MRPRFYTASPKVKPRSVLPTYQPIKYIAAGYCMACDHFRVLPSGFPYEPMNLRTGVCPSRWRQRAGIGPKRIGLLNRTREDRKHQLTLQMHAGKASKAILGEPRLGCCFGEPDHKATPPAALEIDRSCPTAPWVNEPDISSSRDFPHCITSIKMASFIILAISGAFATYLFLHFLLSFTQDAREPPVLASEIPFLSPLIGMRKKAKFYIDLR